VGLGKGPAFMRIRIGVAGLELAGFRQISSVLMIILNYFGFGWSYRALIERKSWCSWL